MSFSPEDRSVALQRLQSDSVEERRAGAEAFRAALWERELVKKSTMSVVRAAIDDPDEAVSLSAARAVLAQAWRYGDTDRILVALEADLAERPELADTVKAIARQLPDVRALEHLAGWLGDKLASDDPDARAVGRTGLANLAHGGYDIGPLAPKLGASLAASSGNESEALLELLFIAAGAHTDLDAVVPIIEPFLQDPDPVVRYRAARTLAVITYRAGDDAKLAAAADHADPAVREGTADALMKVRRWDGFPARAVPLLARHIADDAGGVAQAAVQGLLLAAREGVDIGLAADSIGAAIDSGMHYRSDGRAFPLDPIGMSDLRRLDAVTDLAEALTLSDLRHGSIGMLANRGLGRNERARRGVERALARLEQDAATTAMAVAARQDLEVEANAQNEARPVDRGQ